MTREEFKKLEAAGIEKISKACPNYQDSDSQDALYANSRIAYFYSCIVDKLLKENEELRQTVELKINWMDYLNDISTLDLHCCYFVYRRNGFRSSFSFL